MSSRNWTVPQQAAISDRGGSLLVSAAAGSGKTAVLVERVVGLICDENRPVDISQLLIVTFSNAAAAEMRQRIGQRLSQMIAQRPEDLSLRRQQNLLASSPIRTIHAFCMDLIRENFQNLPISPDFSIMDERELELMKSDAISQSIEEFYDRDESGLFAQLVDLISSGRDDRRLVETVYKIYNFARSHIFYEDWLERKLSMYDSRLPASETVWGTTLLAHATQTVAYCDQLLERSKELLLGDEVLEKAYLPAWESDLAQIRGIQEYLEKGDWDGAVTALRNLDFQRLGRVVGQDSAKESAKEARDRSKTLLNALAKSYLNATQAEFREDVADLQPKIQLLFELVRAFGDGLDRRKRTAKKLDFSDLEQYALQLLVEKRQGGGYEPTAEALLIARQYAHVLVDEYQDTNQVQDMIFSSLSGGGERLFMVGDVKQSIYSFRLAMPEIFMQKKRVAFRYHSQRPNYPAAIMLDTNFRSRKEVTESVNFIFTQTMSLEMGEVDYNEDESLKCGTSYPETALAYPELLLLNAEDYRGEEDFTTLEAKEVAKKIKRMIGERYPVTVKGVLQPVQPGDFCILMRSPRGRSEAYLKALTEEGLTGVADRSGGFLESREIAAIVSLLLALDNPLLDVELAAAMLSPMFSFSADDLAEIRVLAPRVPFYQAVQLSAESGKEQCKELLALFTYLRYYAATHQVDELLLEIYRRTHWLEVARAMSFGEGRQANLLLLVEHATYYQSVGYKGLGGFSALLHRIRERGGDLDSASTSGEMAGAVQILSVHRSKGLEFPVVILADMARQFNKQDLRQSTLLHSDYGFACMRRDPETLGQFPTIPMGAIRLEMQKTMLSEEMRILYVALTRAKEKLILTATIRRNFQRTLEKLYLPLVDGKLPPFLVGEANSYAEWVIMALLHHPKGEELRELAGIQEVEILPDETLWNIELIEPTEEDRAAAVAQMNYNQRPDPQLLATLTERIGFVYPFWGETMVPTKLAVSQVINQKEAREFRFSRRPRFKSSEKLTPTERGNALHKFMQFADYKQAKDNVAQEIGRMYQEEYLTKAETDSLSLESLDSFFRSTLADRIFASPKVLRELRFITEFGQKELAEIVEGITVESKVVLQGVADCVFYEGENAVIVDYKTDRVVSMEQLAERYQQQVMTYRRILEETLGRRIVKGYLYSFHLSKWVDVLALDE